VIVGEARAPAKRSKTAWVCSDDEPHKVASQGEVPLELGKSSPKTWMRLVTLRDWSATHCVRRIRKSLWAPDGSQNPRLLAPRQNFESHFNTQHIIP
jgi:hypothetical protein